MPLYRAIQRETGELLCLVKPLFEVDDAEARRTGVIADSAYAPLLRRLAATLNAQENTRVTGVAHSHVTGNNGTREFFLHVAFGRGAAPELGEAIDAAVARALTLPVYQKS